MPIFKTGFSALSGSPDLLVVPPFYVVSRKRNIDLSTATANPAEKYEHNLLRENAGQGRDNCKKV